RKENRDVAQRGLDWIASAKNPKFAWRYGVRDGTNDTSVTVWMVAALAAAKRVNAADSAAAREESFVVDETSFDGARTWVEKLTDEYGRVGYQQRGSGPARPAAVVDKFPAENSEAMTAAGLFIREACGEAPKSSD